MESCISQSNWSSHAGQLGQFGWEDRTMTAASVVTQLHLQTDLTCVCGSLNHMFTYLLREAADTPEYPKTRQGGGDYWEAERSKVFSLTKLSNSGFDENKGFSART